MSRFFFHVRDDEGLRIDAEGTELPDVEAARKEAVARACEIWSKRPPDSAHNNDTFEITTEAGEVVRRVAFSEAFAERAVT